MRFYNEETRVYVEFDDYHGIVTIDNMRDHAGTIPPQIAESYDKDNILLIPRASFGFYAKVFEEQGWIRVEDCEDYEC